MQSGFTLLDGAGCSVLVRSARASFFASVCLLLLMFTIRFLGHACIRLLEFDCRLTLMRTCLLRRGNLLHFLFVFHGLSFRLLLLLYLWRDWFHRLSCILRYHHLVGDFHFSLDSSVGCMLTYISFHNSLTIISVTAARSRMHYWNFSNQVMPFRIVRSFIFVFSVLWLDNHWRLRTIFIIHDIRQFVSVLLTINNYSSSNITQCRI